MFKIYITNSVYDQINSAESGKSLAERSDLYKILHQQPYKVLTEEETVRLKSEPGDLLTDPSAVYILDISNTEAQGLQKQYGVMCLSGENPDISPLIDVNDVHIALEDERMGRGWDSVLDSIEALPSNALILTDRYLFAFRHPNAGDGIANVSEILDELMPKDFQGGDYHVTVIFDNIAKHSTYSFNEIIQKLEDIKRLLNRPYPIMMETLGITPDCPMYKKLHNRLIISNYYLVEAGHKLAAFNKDRATARQMLIPLTLFTESSINGTSTPPLDAIEQTIDTLQDFSKSLQKRPFHNDYFYAVNGRRMEKCLCMRNRLIK
jgi:hypothetical protein